MSSAEQPAIPDPLFVEEPLDFAESDPSARDGYRVVFDKQCPLEVRIQEHDQSPQEVGTLEAITCRVCVQGDTVAPTAVRLELSSEQDLFFHFQHTLDERAFRLVREEQRLMIEFQDYASVLARSLNQAIKEPHTHLAVFIQNRDGNARLDFIQNLEYKFVELLSVSFTRSPMEYQKEQISFRYQAARARLALVQGRLNDVVNLVKVKNPSLLLSLHQAKAVTGAPTNPMASSSAAASSGGAAFRK